jgi:hypothetical protein
MQFKTFSGVRLIPPLLITIACLAGCPTAPHAPEMQQATTVPQAPAVAPPEAPRHEGRPYDVATGDSLLTILAFRGGALAKAGHNHVIASHDVSGTFYVPDDALHATFELHVPVTTLAIDEPLLRAKEGADFPADVPDSAKEGTRRNMLSEALLNGAQYPEFTLISQHIQSGATGGPTAGAGSPLVQADVQVNIRGQSHTLTVPVTYSLAGDELVVSGEAAVKQSDLGLTPFSAMLGALQVQDEMRIRFRIVARAAALESGAH